MSGAKIITPLGQGTGPLDRAVFLKGICPSGKHEQVAVVTERMVGHRINEVEFHKIQSYLKSQPEVKVCGECGERIGTYSADLTTFGAYRETENKV